MDQPEKPKTLPPSTSGRVGVGDEPNKNQATRDKKDSSKTRIKSPPKSLTSLTSLKSDGFTVKNDPDYPNESSPFKIDFSQYKSVNSYITQGPFDPYDTPIYASPNDTSSLKGVYEDGCFIRLVNFVVCGTTNYVDGHQVGIFTLINIKSGSLLTLKVCFKDQHLGVFTTFRTLRQAGLHPAIGQPPAAQTITDMTCFSRESILERLVIFDPHLVTELLKQQYPFPVVPENQIFSLEEAMQLLVNETASKQPMMGHYARAALPVPVGSLRGKEIKKAGKEAKSSQVKESKSNRGSIQEVKSSKGSTGPKKQ